MNFSDEAAAAEAKTKVRSQQKAPAGTHCHPPPLPPAAKPVNIKVQKKNICKPALPIRSTKQSGRVKPSKRRTAPRTRPTAAAAVPSPSPKQEKQESPTRHNKTLDENREPTPTLGAAAHDDHPSSVPPEQEEDSPSESSPRRPADAAHTHPATPRGSTVTKGKAQASLPGVGDRVAAKFIGSGWLSGSVVDPSGLQQQRQWTVQIHRVSNTRSSTAHLEVSALNSEPVS